MRSRFCFQYSPNGNLTRTKFLDDKLYSGMVATAEYTIKMAETGNPDNWLTNDVVLISFTRPGGESSSVMMTYNAELGGWRYVSNGWETDVDIVSVDTVKVSFVCKRYSVLDPELLVKTRTTEEVELPIHPTAGYIPADIAPGQLDAIMAGVADHEIRINELEDIADEHENEITDLQNRMTTAEEDIDSAEEDIDGLDGRMGTTEEDIDSLKSRMTTAEGDIVTKIPLSQKGEPNGVATLTAEGKVVPAQLPSQSFVSVETFADLPAPGLDNTLYIVNTPAPPKQYVWSGTEYVEVNPTLALGTTSATAHRGDQGNAAYIHSQIIAGNPHNVTKDDLDIVSAGTQREGLVQLDDTLDSYRVDRALTSNQGRLLNNAVNLKAPANNPMFAGKMGKLIQGADNIGAMGTYPLIHPSTIGRDWQKFAEIDYTVHGRVNLQLLFTFGDYGSALIHFRFLSSTGNPPFLYMRGVAENKFPQIDVPFDRIGDFYWNIDDSAKKVYLYYSQRGSTYQSDIDVRFSILNSSIKGPNIDFVLQNTGSTTPPATITDSGYLYGTNFEKLISTPAGFNPSMVPSVNYIELTVLATGSLYTAYNNGYFVANAISGTASFSHATGYNETNKLRVRGVAYSEGTGINWFLPVQKGDVVRLSYVNIASWDSFRFVKAEEV